MFRHTSWRARLGALAIGLFALSIAACAGTAAPTPPAATATPAPTGAPRTDLVDPKALSLIIYWDTVTGADGIPAEERAQRVCILQSRYPQGGKIVWRIRIVDPVTGEQLDDTALRHVTLTLPDGTTKAATFGPHPGPPRDPTDHFWAVSFAIPADYPTGEFKWKLEAEDVDGRTGVNDYFNVAAALTQIVRGP